MGQERSERGQVITRRGLVVGALALTAAVHAGQPSIATAQTPTSSESDSLNLKLLLAAARIDLMSEGARIATVEEVISLSPESSLLTYLNDDGKLQEDPDLKVPPSITLGGGTAVRELRVWFNAVRAAERPASAARPATLVLLDDEDEVIIRYRLTKAWPAALRVANTSTPDKLELQRVRLIFREIHALET